MKMEQLAEEAKLLEDLENRDIKAFIQLYKNNKDDVIIFAFSHLQDRAKVAEAVDELYEGLWVATGGLFFDELFDLVEDGTPATAVDGMAVAVVAVGDTAVIPLRNKEMGFAVLFGEGTGDG